MTTRRNFIKSSGILASAAMLNPQLLIDKPIKNIGIQLYTVRDVIAKNVAGTVSRLAAIGFKEMEIYGYSTETNFWGLSAKAFRQILDSHKLTAPSSHIMFDKFLVNENKEEVKRICEAANTIGNKFVTFPILDEKFRTNLEDYKKLSGQLNTLGRLCKESGLQFAYHNHDFEFKQWEGGRTGYDIILSETDKDLVKLELDLYWTTKAGLDPVQVFERDPGRFVMWHVKDMDPTTRSFTEVGTGAVEFKRIFKNQELAGVKHIFVEQDEIVGDVFESLEKSFNYVKKELV